MGIALVFWVLTKLSQTYTSTKAVVFEFNLPEDVAFSKAPPTDVVAQIEGPGWDLMYGYFTSSVIELSYDLLNNQGLYLSRAQLRADIQNNLFSRDIKIQEVNYDNIRLEVEPKKSRKVPVRLQYVLDFNDNYQLQGHVFSKPDSISLTGPASAIDSVQYWPADSIRLSGLKTTQTLPLSLKKAPREIKLSTRIVNVTVPVEQFTEKSLFVPLKLIQAADSIKIFPQQVSVKCVVGLSRYNEVVADSFQVEANLSNISADDLQNTVLIQLTRSPSFVRNLNYSPKLAKYFIVQDSLPLDSLSRVDGKQ